jgi:hypothetical protein
VTAQSIWVGSWRFTDDPKKKRIKISHGRLVYPYTIFIGSGFAFDRVTNRFQRMFSKSPIILE